MAGVEEEVVGLDVAMENAALVQGFDRDSLHRTVNGQTRGGSGELGAYNLCSVVARFFLLVLAYLAHLRSKVAIRVQVLPLKIRFPHLRRHW